MALKISALNNDPLPIDLNKKFNTEFNFRYPKVRTFGDRKKEKLFSELSLLLNSGVELKKAIEILIHEQHNENDIKIYTSVLNDVIHGMLLSDALRRTTFFNNYELYSLKIGEETGTTHEVLQDFANYYQKRIKQKKQIIGALLYPTLVIIVAVLAVIFMMYYLVPMFSDIFQRFGKELPPITQYVINTSNWLKQNLVYFFILILFLTILYYIFKENTLFRRIIANIALKTPIFKQIIHLRNQLKMCQSLDLLLRTKTPLDKALYLLIDIMSFLPYRDALVEIQKGLLHGKSFHEGLAEFPYFPKRMIELIKIGEEYNQMELVFSQLSKQYSEEMERKISNLNSLLEPMLIVIVGGFVGIILVSMYLPMFQMGTSMF